MTEVIGAPMRATGPVAWARRHFFATWYDAIFSVILGALIIWSFNALISWAFLDAIWTVENKDQCDHGAGACWAVIQDRGRLILFGLYPYEEQWRSTLACLIVIVTMVLSCLPSFWSIRRIPILWTVGFGLFILLMRVVWGFFAYSDNKRYMSPSHHVCRQSPSTSSLLMSNCSQFVSSTGHKTRLLPPFHKRR